MECDGRRRQSVDISCHKPGTSGPPTPAVQFRAFVDAFERLGYDVSRLLADIGMKEADIERAAKIATEAPYPNPRKVEFGPVLALLRDAFEGRRPAA